LDSVIQNYAQQLGVSVSKANASNGQGGTGAGGAAGTGLRDFIKKMNKHSRCFGVMFLLIADSTSTSVCPAC
jgi:hypothetical protein